MRDAEQVGVGRGKEKYEDKGIGWKVAAGEREWPIDVPGLIGKKNWSELERIGE